MIESPTGDLNWGGNKGGDTAPAVKIRSDPPRIRSTPSLKRGRRQALARSLDSLQPAHIGAQNLRQPDGAVGILVIFHHSDQRAADGETRAVQRTDEPRALAFGTAKARVHAPRLELAAHGAGRNLAIAPLPRQPDF